MRWLRPTDRILKYQRLINAVDDHGSVRGKFRHPNKELITLKGLILKIKGKCALKDICLKIKKRVNEKKNSSRIPLADVSDVDYICRICHIYT